ncbi:MAG: DEAD/DEAH box helicase family protein, partial [Patescibacteria group bacterium]
QPTGDQPEAIDKLTAGLIAGQKEHVLLGVTGSGKTYTIANVIEKIQRPTLVISHNKTLAAQLYQEFRDFFPNNAVSYFVSYYDYYQPEAYIPQTDTYIEKETEINEEIDKLRLAATTNLLTRPDTIIVASVSCIYNIGSPKEYGHFVLELARGMPVSRESIFDHLVHLQYERSDYGFHRGTFRVRGEVIDLFPAYEDVAIRMIIELDKLVKLVKLDPLTGKTIENLTSTVIYPAKHYMTDPARYKSVFTQIRGDLAMQTKALKGAGKLLEAHRLEQRVTYDLEMIQELGFVNGIENYSRYFDGRNPGEPPYTLFDYYQEASQNDWLLVIDESHMTIPQIRGMYNGDRSRKQTLIDYGFRLPAAADNRPLRFDEFLRRIPQTIYVSATPNEWELSRGRVVE